MLKIKRYITALLILGLIFSSTQLTFANEATQNVEIRQSISLGKVVLRDNVNAEVKNLEVIQQDNKQVIGVTLSINNNSNSEVNFLDYWLNVSTKSGTKLNVQMVNKNVSKVPAKSSQDINFYSVIGSDIKLSDLVITIIKWDFSLSNYTKVLGKITVPERYNPTTPKNEEKAIATEDTQAVFFVKQTVIGKSESYYKPQIKISIKNDSKGSITLPDYRLYIVTAENHLFPISAPTIKGTVLNPLMEKEFQLTVSIPKEVKQSGWKLAVAYPIDEGKVNYPLGKFDLPQSNAGTAEEPGKYYTFETTQGIYNIKLDSLNRLPIEEDDLIVANMTIANKTEGTIPVPNLIGKYIFNDSIEKEASGTSNEKLISIKAGETIKVQLVGRIPYTFDISELKLILQQKETTEGSEVEIKDLVEFTHSGNFDPVSKVNWNLGFNVTDIGYRSEVKAQNKMLFKGASTDLLAVQLVIKNKEKRSTNIQQLAGYFEKPDGTIYPATFDNVVDKIGPGSNAYVYAWSSVPKDIDTSDINLVVGKAILDKPESADSNSASIVGYSDPYSMILPKELEVQPKLQNIQMPPYNLSIKKSDTKIDYANNTVKLKITYGLTQDLSVKTNTKNDKVIFELKDPNYKSNFTKEFSLPEGLGNNGDSSSLSLGENTTEFSWVDENFVLQIQNLREYQLNVYLQKQPGYKKLIATETIPWFVDRTLSNE